MSDYAHIPSVFSVQTRSDTVKLVYRYFTVRMGLFRVYSVFIRQQPESADGEILSSQGLDQRAMRRPNWSSSIIDRP